MPENFVHTSVTLPSELCKRLTDFCDETALKKSTVIAQALQEYLDRKPQKRKSGRSL